ncbi:unnamed protein product, partial [Ectocarpus fasciculatus]
AEVHIIPVLQDNYSYLFVDRQTGTISCVDPGDAAPVLEKMDQLLANDRLATLRFIFCTHRHWDHVDGNEDILRAFPEVKIIGTAYEPIPFSNGTLSHGEHLQVGSLKVEAMHTPCHTKGHTCYLVSGPKGDPLLFSGDTLFAGGCGRFFEGSAADMLRNMDLISALPGETQIYCGHEYTLSNADFLKSIDPENLYEYCNKFKELRDADMPTVPTTLEEEMSYNLFMKCNDRATQELMGVSSAVDAMKSLRELKNAY